MTTTAVTGYPSDACHMQHEHKDPLYIPTVTRTAQCMIKIIPGYALFLCLIFHAKLYFMRFIPTVLEAFKKYAEV